jgi:hypothetical protein
VCVNRQCTRVLLQIISRVLDSCQGDFDEALEKLTELSLTTNSSPTGEQAGALRQYRSGAGEQRMSAHGKPMLSMLRLLRTICLRAIPEELTRMRTRAQASHVRSMLAERAHAAHQQHSPVAPQPQRRQEDGAKASKVAPGSVNGPDEVQQWTAVLCDEVTASVDAHDLNRRIFHFLTLCKQHIEQTQVRAQARSLLMGWTATHLQLPCSAYYIPSRFDHSLWMRTNSWQFAG